MKVEFNGGVCKSLSSTCGLCRGGVRYMCVRLWWSLFVLKKKGRGGGK